jgi:hypothetical protein
LVSATLASLISNLYSFHVIHSVLDKACDELDRLGKALFVFVLKAEGLAVVGLLQLLDAGLTQGCR